MNTRLKKNVKMRFLLALGLGVLLVQPAFGHFVWVARSDGEIRVYFGEAPEPSDAKLLGRLSALKAWHAEDGEFKVLEFSKATDGELGWLGASSQASQVDIDCVYGLFTRGDVTRRLHYTAKYVDARKNTGAKASGKLVLDVVPTVNDDTVSFKILLHGKPLSECELTVYGDENRVLKSDEQGVVSLKTGKSNQLRVRAKATDETAGETDGKSYSGTSFYCTLVLDMNQPDDESKSKDEPSLGKAKQLPEIPVGLTSFGAAVSDGHLYLFGGHQGNAHSYYESGQNNVLYRLNLAGGDGWESLCEGTGLQGLAMVSHQGHLYRLGGFHAHNKKGEDNDLRSVTEFARYDDAKKTWEQLPPMPEPRSSFDACVMNDAIYVIGGWAMMGKEAEPSKPVWRNTALRFDLSSDNAKWETLPAPPFRRRALSVGYQGDKVVAVGGMQQKGGPTRKVALFDTQSNEWSEGPELPGEEAMEGFGSTCFNVGGRLVVSTYSGRIFRLSENADAWEPIHTLEVGRFFHRLVAVKENQFLLIGGANMESGKIKETELYTVPESK